MNASAAGLTAHHAALVSGVVGTLRQLDGVREGLRDITVFYEE